MSGWKLVAGAIAGLVIAGLCLWFARNFDRVEVEVESGYRGESRRNAYLAAQRLLESFDLRVESGYNLSGTPPRAGTLVLLDRHRSARPKRTREILAWVDTGGHLLMVASDEDPLQEVIAVRTIRHSDGDRYPTATASLPGSGDLAVEVYGRWALAGPPLVKEVARAGERVHALSVRYGGGWVTVVSDVDFMRNRSIASHDHAMYLWSLVHRDGARDVWLVRGEDTPPFWGPLFMQSWPVWSSALVLLAAILWSAGRRFGPLLPPPAAGRRRLLDHIVASGDFYWRLGKSDVLVRAVRDSLERTLEFRHPGWLMSGKLAERLAQLSGITRAEVHTALADETANDPEQFTRTIATLERIRRHL